MYQGEKACPGNIHWLKLSIWYYLLITKSYCINLITVEYEVQLMHFLNYTVLTDNSTQKFSTINQRGWLLSMVSPKDMYLAQFSFSSTSVTLLTVQNLATLSHFLMIFIYLSVKQQLNKNIVRLTSFFHQSNNMWI